MHAFLITCGSADQRDGKADELVRTWSVAVYDRHILETADAPSIGIADVRVWLSSLILKPVSSPYTAGIIRDAHKLTAEAQNAVLKTLEEPPPHVRIILLAPHASSLLPTITSRCQTMPLPASGSETDGDNADDVQSVLSELASAGVAYGRIVAVIDTVAANREDAKGWTQRAIRIARKGAVQDVRILRNLLTAYEKLCANVNPKLALDEAFFALKKPRQT